MRLINEIIEDYYNSDDGYKGGQRLGQYFVNNFLTGTYAEIFYSRDDDKAIELIMAIIEHNQWHDCDIEKLRINRSKIKQ